MFWPDPLQLFALLAFALVLAGPWLIAWLDAA
jgi:hypothetical protein